MFKSIETELKLDNDLNVDDKLQLSCEDLVDEIRRQIVTNGLSKEEKLKTIGEFPSPGVFATFSWRAYDTFEKEVTLPEGWRLLTTASNKDIANGYFGAAFWHPEAHHMVVAHRGTEVNNVGAVVADIAGIVFNNYGGQMESACTFADRIVDTLKTIEGENEDVHFELFFTGHSLGAWLAQVSTFTNEFLRRDFSDEWFTRLSQGDTEPYHAHATVFDSPGALPMLKKLKAKFEMEGRAPIELSNLNITSYLSAPNQVNTCNEHFGKVYRVFVDTSKMNFMDRNVGYTLTTHSIEKIVDCFTAKEVQVEEVLEWPIRESITSGQELDKFLKHADHRNRYRLTRKLKETAKNLDIRYKTRIPDRTTCAFNVFSKHERQFLEHFRWMRQLPEFASVKALLGEIKCIAQSSDEIIENLTSFDIVDQNFRIADPEMLKVFIPKMKFLLKLYPAFAERARDFIVEHNIREKIFAFETKLCLEVIRRDVLDFKPTTIDLSKFLKKQFSQLKVKSGKARSGLSMIYKTFEKSPYNADYDDHSVLVLNLKRFSVIDQLINFKDFLASNERNFLAILYNEDNEELSDTAKESIKQIFDILKEHQQVKVILVGDSDDGTVDFMNQQAKEKLQERFYEIEKGLNWSELTKESQQKLLNSTVKFQGTDEKFKDLLAADGIANLDDKVLLQLLNESAQEVNADPLVSCSFAVYTTDHEKIEIKPRHIIESLEFGDDVFIISGLYEESVDDAAKSLTDILKPSNDKERLMIECNIVLGAEKLDKPGKLQLVNIVGSDPTLDDFDDKCRNYCTKNLAKILHWIKVKEGKLTWRKSYNFSAYVNRSLKVVSRPVDGESKVINQTEKFTAIVGQSGEGKSTYLTHYMMHNSEISWVVFFNFADLQFDALKTDKLETESLAAFITSAAGYDADNHLQSFLLRHKILNQTEKPLHLVFDGFDEITVDKDRVKALKLLRFIREETKCCVTIACRDQFVTQLSDMQPTIYNFEKFSRAERERLLKESWRSRFNLIYGQRKCLESFSDEKKSKFQHFVKVLLDQLDSSIDAKAGSVLGIPKQLKLLADGFQEDFDKYVVPTSIRQKIFDSLKMKTFYNHYLNTKYDIYVTAKVQAASIDQKSKSLFKAFNSISVDSLMPQDAKDLLSSKSEFLSPDYVILRLTKNQPPPKVLAVFTGYLLTDPRCGSIRSYLNKHEEFLPRTAEFDISDEIVANIVGQPMITVAKEGHDNLVEFLIAVLKKSPDLKGIVLGVDSTKKDALTHAIENCHEDCVKLLTEFLLESGDQNELKETLKKIDNQTLKQFGLKCKSYAFADWFQDFLINNGIKVTF